MSISSLSYARRENLPEKRVEPSLRKRVCDKQHRDFFRRVSLLRQVHEEIELVNCSNRGLRLDASLWKISELLKKVGKDICQGVYENIEPPIIRGRVVQKASLAGYLFDSSEARQAICVAIENYMARGFGLDVDLEERKNQRVLAGLVVTSALSAPLLGEAASLKATRQLRPKPQGGAEIGRLEEG